MRRHTVERVADLGCDHLGVGGEVARQHGMNVWCGVGERAESAREHLASAMTSVYQLPFEKFEQRSPSGMPDDVAGFLAPYVDAGCVDFNLIVQAESVDAAIEGGAAVAQALGGSR